MAIVPAPVGTFIVPSREMRRKLKSNFLNDQSSAEGKKIALKSPARALSNGTVYLFRQELLRGAIIVSNLLSLHGHCLAISKILDPNIFLDINFIFFRIEWCAFGFCN